MKLPLASLGSTAEHQAIGLLRSSKNRSFSGPKRMAKLTPCLPTFNILSRFRVCSRKAHRSSLREPLVRIFFAKYRNISLTAAHLGEYLEVRRTPSMQETSKDLVINHVIYHLRLLAYPDLTWECIVCEPASKLLCSFRSARKHEVQRAAHVHSV